MNKLIGALVALAGAASLAACATQTPPDVPLAAAAQQNIASTDAVVAIQQHEIYVYVPPSTAGAVGGASAGLVGALIGAAIDSSVDSVRSSRAEAAVKPLRDAIVDFSFDDTFRADLQTALAQDAWLHATDAHLVKEVTPQAMDADIAASKSAAVLIATADYQLSNDGQVLTVTVNANMFANSDTLASFRPKNGNTDVRSAPANAIYRNSFSFLTKAPGATADRAANIAAWSANHGEALRAALKLASRQISGMMAADISGRDPATADKLKAGFVSGGIVSKGTDGDVVRSDSGTMTFVATSMLSQ